MLRFFVKRILLSVVVIIGVSMLIFIIARIVPGDPARMALGPRASQEVVDALRIEMNLERPLPTQYAIWAQGVLRGDFGTSILTRRAVSEDIRDFLPATLELILVSGIIMVIGSFIFGIISVRFRDTWVDGIIRVMSNIRISVPAFVMAIIFMLVFGFLIPIVPAVGRISGRIVTSPPITGMIIFDNLVQGNFTAAWNALQHIFLPAFALAIGPMFQEARILRASLIDNISKEYISVSTGYGLPKNVVLGKYLLKPSAVSVITVMGLDFAALMGNAFLVERIFNWPGLSRYGINAMLHKDLNSISAVIIIIGILFMVMNIIVDLLMALLDPRIRGKSR